MAITFTATDSVDYEPGVYQAKLKELETAESSIGMAEPQAAD